MPIITFQGKEFEISNELLGLLSNNASNPNFSDQLRLALLPPVLNQSSTGAKRIAESGSITPPINQPVLFSSIGQTVGTGHLIELVIVISSNPSEDSPAQTRSASKGSNSSSRKSTDSAP